MDRHNPHFDKHVKAAITRIRDEREAIIVGANTLNDELDAFSHKFDRNMTKPGEMNKSVEMMEKYVQSFGSNHAQAVKLLASSVHSDAELEVRKEEFQQILADVGGLEVIEPQVVAQKLKNEFQLASNRLKDIFTQGKKEYSQAIAAIAENDEDEIAGNDDPSKPTDNSNQENSLVFLKRRYERTLGKLEILELKMNSVLVQYAADRKRFEETMARQDKFVETITNRLAIADGKRRFNYQVGRDDSFVSNVVSRFEFEEVKKDRDTQATIVKELNVQLSESKEVITKLNQDVRDLQSSLVQAETKKVQAEKSEAAATKKFQNLEAQVQGMLTQPYHKYL